MSDESKFLREQAADEKLIDNLDANIAEIKQRPTYKNYVQGKEEFKQVLALTKDRNHVNSRKSLRGQAIGDLRAANCHPLLTETRSELFEDRIKTYSGKRVDEEKSKNLLGLFMTTFLICNEKAVEARVAVIDAAIRQIEQLMREPAIGDVEQQIEQIRNSIPPWSSLNRMEKIAVAPQSSVESRI